MKTLTNPLLEWEISDIFLQIIEKPGKARPNFIYNVCIHTYM